MKPLFTGTAFTAKDPRRSAVTGLTRAHWVAVADHLLDGSLVARGPEPWLLRFPGRTSANGHTIDGLEGFARTLLLAAFRLQDPLDDVRPEWLEALTAGLESGAIALAERHENRWPLPVGSSQALVEASSIATALVVAREHLWNPLSASAKDQLHEWLAHALAPRASSNNWVFFPATIAVALEGLGRGDARTAATIDALCATVSAWRLGDGWFSDGPGERVDYYNAWSFHYYLPLLAHLSGRADITELARATMAGFLRAYPLLFDGTGAPVYVGRSLTYRFAAVAPLFTAQLIGADPVDAGIHRAIASSALATFVGAGAIENGVLSVGWLGAHDGLAQEYSSAGSPLWAAKGFVGLLLGAEHPVWNAPEKPFAVETARTAPVALSERSALLLVRDARDGASLLFSGGITKWPSWAPQSRDVDPLYARLAYSSLTAPLAGSDIPENTVTVQSGATRAHPAPTTSARVGDDWVSTTADLWHDRPRAFPPTYRWGHVTRRAQRVFAPLAWRRGRVAVLSLVVDGHELRVCRVTGVPAGSTVRLGFFAIPHEGDVALTDEPSTIELRSAESRHRVIALESLGSVGVEEAVDPTNPFGSAVSVPVLTAVADASGVAEIAAVSWLGRISSAPDTARFALRRDARGLTLLDATTGRANRVAVTRDTLIPGGWLPSASRD